MNNFIRLYSEDFDFDTVDTVKTHIYGFTVFNGQVIMMILLSDDNVDDKDKIADIWLLEVESRNWTQCDSIAVPSGGVYHGYFRHHHLIHFMLGPKQIHFAFDSYEIIPAEILNKYTTHQEIVITGFVRDCVSIVIPNDIILLMTSFYAIIF